MVIVRRIDILLFLCWCNCSSPWHPNFDIIKSFRVFWKLCIALHIESRAYYGFVDLISISNKKLLWWIVNKLILACFLKTVHYFKYDTIEFRAFLPNEMDQSNKICFEYFKTEFLLLRIQIFYNLIVKWVDRFTYNYATKGINFLVKKLFDILLRHRRILLSASCINLGQYGSIDQCSLQ